MARRVSRAVEPDVSADLERDALARIHWMVMGTATACDPPNDQATAAAVLVAAKSRRLKSLGLSPVEHAERLEDYMRSIRETRGIRLADHLEERRETKKC